MSIIYEALKKTQESTSVPPKEGELSGSGPRERRIPGAGAEEKLSPKRKHTFFMFLFIFLGIIGAWVITKQLEKFILPATPLASKTTLTKELPSASTLPSSDLKPGVPAATVLKQESKPSIQDYKPEINSVPQEEEFSLNGILASSDENLALINGQVVRVGDEVNGAFVIKVDSDRVIMGRDGQEIILKQK